MASNFAKQQYDMKLRYFNAGMVTGYQKCWDLLCLVVNDPVLLHGYRENLNALEKQYGMAWDIRHVEADIAQRDIDAGLTELFGPIQPFAVRHPNIKAIDYSKGNKHWR